MPNSYRLDLVCPRATGQRGLIAKNCGETATWVCAGSTLSDEMHLDFQKLQRNWAFCVSMVLHSPSRTRCVSIVKSEVILRFSVFGWFCIDPFAPNAFRWSKLRWYYVFLRLDGFVQILLHWMRLKNGEVAFFWCSATQCVSTVGIQIKSMSA